MTRRSASMVTTVPPVIRRSMTNLCRDRPTMILERKGGTGRQRQRGEDWQPLSKPQPCCILTDFAPGTPTRGARLLLEGGGYAGYYGAKQRDELAFYTIARLHDFGVVDGLIEDAG